MQWRGTGVGARVISHFSVGQNVPQPSPCRPTLSVKHPRHLTGPATSGSPRLVGTGSLGGEGKKGRKARQPTPGCATWHPRQVTGGTPGSRPGHGGTRRVSFQSSEHPAVTTVGDTSRFVDLLLFSTDESTVLGLLPCLPPGSDAETRGPRQRDPCRDRDGFVDRDSGHSESTGKEGS